MSHRTGLVWYWCRDQSAAGLDYHGGALPEIERSGYRSPQAGPVSLLGRERDRDRGMRKPEEGVNTSFMYSFEGFPFDTMGWKDKAVVLFKKPLRLKSHRMDLCYTLWLMRLFPY